MFPEFLSLGDFLAWLASVPGALIATGFFVSYILERLTFWHKVPKDAKVLITLGIAALVSWLAKNEAAVSLIVNNEILNYVFSFYLYYLSNQTAYKKYFKV